MRIKIAIIGVGNFGSKYIEIINKRLNNKIEIYIYDKDITKLKKISKNYPEINRIKELHELSSIDGVIIATPAFTHHIYAKICIANKIPFLCEKPLGVDYLKWKKLIDQLDKFKLISGVGYPRRYLKVNSYIKNIIKSKKMGKLILIQSNFSQDFRNLRKNYKKSYYINKTKGGGIILDALTHHLNWLTFFAGKYINLKIFSEKKIIKSIDSKDYANFIIKFKNGISGLIVGNQFQKPNYDRVEFVFDKGNLTYDRISGNLKIFNDNKILINKKFIESWEDLISKQILSFIKSIKQNQNLLLTNILDDYINIKNIKKYNK